MSEENTMPYARAVARLDDILKQLQADDCDIDRLTALTKEAAGLLDFCRGRLVATEDELQAVLKTLREGQ